MLRVDKAIVGAVRLAEGRGLAGSFKRLLVRLIGLGKRLQAAVVGSVHLDCLFLLRAEDGRRLHRVKLSLSNLGNQFDLG